LTPALRQVRPLLRVALPVAVTAALVALAIINIAVVKTWHGEPDDGVWWQEQGIELIAQDVAPDGPGARSGVKPGDVLLQVIDGRVPREIQSRADVLATLHDAEDGRPLQYVIVRQTAEQPLTLVVHPERRGPFGLYYSLALVGMLSIVVGASVHLRRPMDPATLHFFWLTVAFFGVLAFHPAGLYNRLDYVFDWSDAVARLALPPLFLHFALKFPDRAHLWIRTPAGRTLVVAMYLPAVVVGLWRVRLYASGLHGPGSSLELERIEWFNYAYLTVCLLGGLTIMVRALRRLRSVTARRQLRWIVWGSSLGAVPFLLLYVGPLLFGRPPAFAGYTAVLLGCIPLAFASAIVRYRLMDVEVIIKRVLVMAAVVLALALVYESTFRLGRFVFGIDPARSSNWALLSTLIVALLAPWMRHAIQAGLDRLYYKDHYDYRRALVTFTRELNSDLDLTRLTERLVTRIQETLGVEKIAVFQLESAALPDPCFSVVAATGFDSTGGPGLQTRAHRSPGGPGLQAGLEIPPIRLSSPLGARLAAGHAAVLDDPTPARRYGGDDAPVWRDIGLYHFIPCVSKETTIAVIAAGQRPYNEPLSSEDTVLLGAVAGQAATALENARLYGQLRDKADEIERLRQFSDSVVESLSDGLIVLDLDDCVLRWNHRAETLTGITRDRAAGRRLAALFSRTFVDAVAAARRESPSGAALYRVALEAAQSDAPRLVNLAIAPFQTEGRQAGWILVIEDVTERASLEEQLRLSEKMAAIGLLAAGVAHEVNTPLTGISSYTQMLLQRSAPEDPNTQLLEKIERQTFRAAKIVNSLLNLARPSGGEMTAVDLHAVIGDILSLLEHQFRVAHIQVRRELDESPAVVRGVEYKLQQVFLNLFLNARDAMPKGGWLTVATQIEDTDVVVEVSDTGQGIPAELLARIYDPFFTTKGEGQGTGLGLSVTYGIVREHNGTLTCESEVGKGTCFRLTLPRY
jgi:PAS domain S-box-containing protein